MAFDFGAAGGGAAAGLEDVLKRMFLEQVQRQKVAQEQAELAERARGNDLQYDLGQGQLGLGRARLGEDTRQFDQSHALNTAKHDEDVRQFNIEQPLIGRLRTAQAADLERRPEAEEAERAFTTQRDARQHGFRLGEIGAQGANQMRVAQFRAAGGQSQVGAQYGAERAQRVRDSIAEIKGLIRPGTTGMGSLLSNVPATDARLLAGKLNTLKSAIAFNELAEMRAASKTGGALGAVSEKELTLLESALGAIDQGLEGKDLAGELDKIDGIVDRWNAAKAGQGGAAPAPTGTGGGGGADNDPLGLFK